MLDRIRRANGQDGFTLIELLIVIIILGILAAIVVFAVGGITDRGNKSACKTDLKTVEVAGEAYFAKNGNYAASMLALKTAGLLRDVPSTTNGYTIAYSADNTASPKTMTVTGDLDGGTISPDCSV